MWPLVHAQARKGLKTYRNTLVQQMKSVVATQLLVLEKACQPPYLAIDRNQQVDHLLALAKDLQKSAALFSDHDTLIVDPEMQRAMPIKAVITERIQTLKNTIATRKGPSIYARTAT